MRDSNKQVDLGLLVLRVGFGIMFMLHGYPKMAAGPETWVQLGNAMGTFGITFAPQFWGFFAALAELAGGVALILGLAVRPASFFLLCTMIVAACMHLSAGHGILKASHAIEAGVVFLSLLCMGGGSFTVMSFFNKKSSGSLYS
jgi:putative oxidoreductase